MVNDRVSHCPALDACKRRREAEAVLSGIRGQLRSRDVRSCGEQVGQATKLFRHGSRPYLARPTDDKWYAVPALINVAFQPTPICICAMREPSLILQSPIGAVVAG